MEREDTLRSDMWCGVGHATKIFSSFRNFKMFADVLSFQPVNGDNGGTEFAKYDYITEIRRIVVF